MPETAMRDANDRLVFVSDNGSYTEQFPTGDIVRETGASETEFIVYGFVGTQGNFEEQRWFVETEREAIQKATDIYGRDDVRTFSRRGEVFDVEVHEVSKETAQDMK